MLLYPPFEEFAARARAADIVPVWCEFLFDVDTAVTAYAKLARPPFGFLLESVVGGEQWARYTFLGSEPAAAWRLRGGAVEEWTAADGWRSAAADDPLTDFDRRVRARRASPMPELPRFWGGAVGYFGYDVVRRIERLSEPPRDDLRLPEAVFIFTDVVLAIDNLLGRAMAIAATDVRGADESALRVRYDAAGEKLDRLARDLAAKPPPAPLQLRPEPVADPGFESSMTRQEFEDAVRRVKEYILAGDAFQVVLSQRLNVALEASPFELYRALRSLNPSPYLYFLDLDGLELVGSSPEVLVRVEDGKITLRPIAGTRPRGRTPAEDRALAEDLRADEKELAEHRMLVDLGRNDVGRVARYGTVCVPELMVIERYSHVMHLVSQVEGQLRDDLSALDVFRACFPAGTVTGAPKIRAMEIIDELEPVRRGPYAGAVGYVAYGGMNMDTAIAIRTVVVARGRANVQAGAGIVADSVPEREYQETLNKARALLRAAHMVARERSG
ncbi:MAG: anthranilate synthase component I [Gemmatimonadetes bacterium]|nr:anthranilate synthase component I [Gemmatimonadota bacterium]